MARALALCAAALLLVAAALAPTVTADAGAGKDVSDGDGSSGRLPAAALGGAARRLLATCTPFKVKNSAGQCVCKPGYETSSNGLCSKCKPGFQKPTAGNYKCTCLAGYEPGPSSTCVQCKAGFYKPNAGSAKCAPCPAGYVQPKTGKTLCGKCASNSMPNPARTRCQLGCATTNDGSVVHLGRFWAVNKHTFDYGSSNETSAVEVCNAVTYDGAKWLIPANIKDATERKLAANLTNFAFQCEPMQSQTRYWAWVLKDYLTSVPNSQQFCNELFHQPTDDQDGAVYTITGSSCNAPNGIKYPVMCQAGCAPFCFACNSGKCINGGCVLPYTWSSAGGGTCVAPKF